MINRMMMVLIFKDGEILVWINLDMEEADVENGWYKRLLKFFVLILSDIDINFIDIIMISKDK